MSNGKIIINAESIGYEKSDEVSIGIIEHSDAPPYRTSLVLQKSDWKEEKGRLIASKEINSYSPTTTSVDIFLSFRGEHLDMLTVRNPSALLENPIIKVYEHFDKDLTILNKYIESLDSDCFVKGIGLLLHFCGFNVGIYELIKGKKGISGIQEEIDVVAFAPDNYVIAAECTTSDIDVKGKISKFSRRTKELRNLLADYTVADYIVIPLIFTALEREKISKSDLKKAGEEGIGVVAIENIRELLEMAGQQKGLKEILTYLDSFVAESLSYNK